MIEQCTQKAFFRWLRARIGQKVKIEDFRLSHKRDDLDWQRVNSGLVTIARAARRGR